MTKPAARHDITGPYPAASPDRIMSIIERILTCMEQQDKRIDEIYRHIRPDRRRTGHRPTIVRIK